MKRSVWITFGALCLLSSSAWVVEPFSASTLPSLQRQGLIYLLIGLTALLLSGTSALSRSRSELSPTRQQQRWTQLTVAGLLFFAIPAAAIELAGGSVPEISRSALFAMVPIVAIVVLSAVETGRPAERGARRSLIPALVGLGGLLLLLPLSFSNSARSNAMIAVLCTAVVLAGIAAVWLYRILPQFALPNAVAVVCLSNAVFLLLCAAAGRTAIWDRSSLLSLLSPSSLVDVLEILLLLWLVRTMPPVQFASRYLLIPLLTVLEAYALLRPELTLRIGAGAVLLTIGAALLLLQHPAEEAVLSLR